MMKTLFLPQKLHSINVSISIYIGGNKMRKNNGKRTNIDLEPCFFFLVRK